MLCQFLTRSSFQRSSCKVEPKTIVENLPWSITLKSLVMILYNIVISCIGHLESIDSLRYARFPNVHTFWYTILKTTFVNMTTDLVRKMCI